MGNWVHFGTLPYKFNKTPVEVPGRLIYLLELYFRLLEPSPREERFATSFRF